MMVLKSYFANRKLIFNTSEGERVVDVTSGVQQGSIFGPTLWKVTYNRVLTVELPEGEEIIGFADGI